MTEKQGTQKIRTRCPRCSGTTNHEILYEFKKHFDPSNTPHMGIDFAEGSWQVVRCLGCDDVSFREYWVTSEDWDPVNEGIEGTEYRYPRAEAKDLTKEDFERGIVNSCGLVS